MDLASPRPDALWIKRPLAIWTGTNDDARGGVVISGSRIVGLVASGGQPVTPVSTVIDASRHVVLPGMVNGHHHLYQTLTRVVPSALNKPLFPWLQSLYPVWARLDEQSIAVSTRLGLVELLLSGCTACVDHHYVFGADLGHALDVQVAAARDVPVRVLLTRGSMSQGQSQGALPPDSVVQNEAVILEDCARCVERFHDASEDSFCQVALAPCSPFSVSSELLRDSAVLAREKGVRLHTHLAETEDETQYCVTRFGKRPLDYVADLGWLGDDVWLAHGIHFTPDELRRLGSASVGICHCPTSNMLLASGICPTLELEESGSPVGLGVDGSASNCTGNLIAEARQALLLQRLKYGAERITEDVVLRWATTGGARLLGRPELGQLAVGKLADMALFLVDDVRFSGSLDPVAALLLCGASRADKVLVGGRVVVSDGQVLGVDLARLRAEHDVSRDRLLGL